MNRKNLYHSNLSKLFYALITLLITSNLLVAQTNVSIAPVKMNVFYIGVDNPVAVAASNSADENITVSIDGGGGRVAKTGSGTYNVQVTSVTDECVINVYVDGKLTGSSNFKVRNIPLPTPTVGGLTPGNEISADAIRKQKGVASYIKDFPFAVRYDILGFTFKIEDEAGNSRTAECEGAMFCEQVKELLAQDLKQGTKITIENIRTKDPSGKEHVLFSLVYYIK